MLLMAFSATYSTFSPRLPFPSVLTLFSHTHTYAHQQTHIHTRSSVSLLISESCILPLMLSASRPLYPVVSLPKRPGVGSHSFKKYTYLLTSVTTFQLTIKSAAAGKTLVTDLSRLVCADEIAAGNCAQQKAILAYSLLEMLQ